MAWRIEFDPSAEKELGKLDREAAQRILKFLFDRVAKLDDPRGIGEALKGSKLGNFWKYRVGDYRIITDIQDSALHGLRLERQFYSPGSFWHVYLYYILPSVTARIAPAYQLQDDGKEEAHKKRRVCPVSAMN